MHIAKLTAAAATGLMILASPAMAQMADEEVPPANIDTDGDGTADAWDANGDGVADAWDTDGDGAPDAWDKDGDGKPDKSG